MRLFVEAQDLPNLKTWWVAQESETLVYGVKTKGLIVENFQLQTEFPDNLEELDGHKWHLLYEDGYMPVGFPLLPGAIRNSEAKKDAEALNTALTYIIIFLSIWLIIGWYT